MVTTITPVLNPDWRELPIWVLEFMLDNYPGWQRQFVGFHRVNQNAYDVNFVHTYKFPGVVMDLRVKRSEANTMFKQRTGESAS